MGGEERFYIVDSGICKVSQMVRPSFIPWGLSELNQDLFGMVRSVDNTAEKTFHAASWFGMLELLYGCPSQCTVITETEVQTLSISRDELEMLLADEVQEALEIMKKSLRLFLLGQLHPCVRESDETDLMTVVDQSTPKQYKHWDLIVSKGDRVDKIFLLEEGKCILYDGEASLLREDKFDMVDCEEVRCPGASFGTSSAIGVNDVVAPFTVVAISECVVVHVPKAFLEAMTLFRSESHGSC